MVLYQGVIEGPHPPNDTRGLWKATFYKGFRLCSQQATFSVWTAWQFYESGPKLSIPRMDPFARTAEDRGGSVLSRRSILASGPEPERSSLQRSASKRTSSDSSGHQERPPAAPPTAPPWASAEPAAGQRGVLRSTSVHSQWQGQGQGQGLTPAETVAALKASMAAMDVGGVGRLPGGGVTPQLDLTGSLDTDEPAADPRRLDDLPPRPTTSRGRPSSSHGPGSQALDGFPMTSQPGRTPLPSHCDSGTGAQVLDVLAVPHYSDSDSTGDEDDAPYAHLYRYDPASGPGGLAPHLRPGSGPGSGAGSPPTDPTQAAQGLGSDGSAAGAPRPPLVLDPSQPFLSWRAAVEASLQQLAAGAAALGSAPGRGSGGSGGGEGCGAQGGRQEVLAGLMKSTGQLVALAEVCRQQPHASKWLNSSSTCYADASGCWLSLREAMAEHVFRLMDSACTELLLKATAVVLRVVKSRQPLLQAGKLLYRFAIGLGGLAPRLVALTTAAAAAAGPQQPAPPWKTNVSNEAANQRALVKAGGLHVMAGALLAMVEQSPQPEWQQRRQQQQRPGAGSSAALQAAGQALPGQTELVLNMGRVLSKLSLDEQCQAALEADRGSAPLLVGLLARHLSNRPLLLRLAFVLGNLTTHSDIYRQQQGSGDQRRRPNLGKGAAAGAGGAERVCGLQVGAELCSQGALASSLLALLERHQYSGGAEELVLNACCMLTNLSFYHQPDNKLLAMEPSLLLRHVTPLLLSDNEEAVVEAARAFGNFSRTAESRQYLVDARVLEALVLLLDHSSAEVLYSVCGTLINFSADTSRKAELVQLGAHARLVDVLERCAALAVASSGDAASGVMQCDGCSGVCLAHGHAGNPALEHPVSASGAIPAAALALWPALMLAVVSVRMPLSLLLLGGGSVAAVTALPQVHTLCVVCKALFNLCADEASCSGTSAKMASNILSASHVSRLDAALQAVRAAKHLMAQPEVPQVTSRLLAIAQKFLIRPIPWKPT
ncbi:hypothetical protein V8C86DRAFT_2432954 [Haematococcus lacustris]